jgi:hypothetical protein
MKVMLALLADLSYDACLEHDEDSWTGNGLPCGYSMFASMLCAAQAAELYAGEEQSSEANKCRLKVRIRRQDHVKKNY